MMRTKDIVPILQNFYKYVQITNICCYDSEQVFSFLKRQHLSTYNTTIS